MRYKIIFLLSLLIVFSKNIECSPSLITNPYRNDGFGAQFQSIIFAAFYAELNGMRFAYTPFRQMEHNYNDAPSFLQKKENFINFLGNFDLNEDFTLQQVMSVQRFQDFFDTHLFEFLNSKTLKFVKQIFRSNKTKPDYYMNQKLNVAVHIRRPNSHDSRYEGADIPDHVYLKILDQLRAEYQNQDIQFHLFSQGDLNNFQRIYFAKDITLHIDTDLEETFASMVFADILVTSSSSFSYVAGFLCEGKVFYIPFWHPPLPSWAVLDIGWTRN